MKLSSSLTAFLAVFIPALTVTKAAGPLPIIPPGTVPLGWKFSNCGSVTDKLYLTDIDIAYQPGNNFATFEWTIGAREIVYGPINVASTVGFPGFPGYDFQETTDLCKHITGGGLCPIKPGHDVQTTFTYAIPPNLSVGPHDPLTPLIHTQFKASGKDGESLSCWTVDYNL